MKAVLFRVRFSALTKVNPLQLIEEWFHTETGKWAVARIPREHIEIQSSDGIEVHVIADLEPEDYTYWNLRWG